MNKLREMVSTTWLLDKLGQMDIRLIWSEVDIIERIVREEYNWLETRKTGQ